MASTLVLSVLARTALAMASAGQSAVPSRGITVYVGDFELSVAPAPGSDAPNPGSEDKPVPQLRLCQAQNYFAETLVDTLRKQGYSSSRTQVLSGKGILLKGVFAEPDEKNRIRVALLGSGSRPTKLTLYVGAFDAKSASQPLYVEAPVQDRDPNYGPVITLSSYIPMAKYEMNKEIAEEDVRNICAQITADVTALVARSQVSNIQ